MVAFGIEECADHVELSCRVRCASYNQISFVHNFSVTRICVAEMHWLCVPIYPIYCQVGLILLGLVFPRLMLSIRRLIS